MTADDEPFSSDNRGEKSSRPSGLRNVFALGLVSFFTDFSTEMVLGILPLFVVNNLGASRALLGTMEGSAELISYTSRMISGSLSDHFHKRKIFVLIGYGLSTISKPFLAFSTSWIDAFAVRAVDRIGKGIRTAPRDALIADSVSTSISGKAFGIHRTIDQLGAILGPIAAFMIIQVLDIQWVFLFSLIPGAIAVIILIFYVKEVMVRRNGTDEDEDDADRLSTTSSSHKQRKRIPPILTRTMTLVKVNRPFLILVIISGVFSLGAFNFSFVLLKSQDFGISANDIPLVYAVINVTHTIIGIPMGIFADRVGKEKALIIGFSIFVVSLLLMIGLESNAYFFAYMIAAIFGLYIGTIETVQRAVIPGYVSPEMRGTAFGLYYVVIGFGFFVCNILFGFLWDAFGFNVAAIYSLIFSIGAIFGMLLFSRRFVMTVKPL
ncbi:MAG: MFS transporter [Nitrososphaeraceae archaeon]|nr:MFS transporter [Nitrososphaeraceae archaeon]